MRFASKLGQQISEIVIAGNRGAHPNAEMEDSVALVQTSLQMSVKAGAQLRDSATKLEGMQHQLQQTRSAAQAHDQNAIHWTAQQVHPPCVARVARHTTLSR